MYKIRTILKVYNKDQALAEKLSPLLDEADKMQDLMIEELLNLTGPQYCQFCMHQQETDCDCADCKRSCAEEVYNFFEREVEREGK